MSTMALIVGGMSCRRCVREVTSRLRDVAGVDIVTADPGTSVVRLSGTLSGGGVLGALRDLICPTWLLAEAAGAAGPPDTKSDSMRRQRRDRDRTAAIMRVADTNR